MYLSFFSLFVSQSIDSIQLFSPYHPPSFDRWSIIEKRISTTISLILSLLLIILRIVLLFFYKNKRYSFIQIDRVHRYNTNLKSLKTKG